MKQLLGFRKFFMGLTFLIAIGVFLQSQVQNSTISGLGALFVIFPCFGLLYLTPYQQARDFYITKS